MNSLKLKPIVNKNNGQITLSLPKKQLDKELLKSISKGKKIRVNVGDWFD